MCSSGVVKQNKLYFDLVTSVLFLEKLQLLIIFSAVYSCEQLKCPSHL